MLLSVSTELKVSSAMITLALFFLFIDITWNGTLRKSLSTVKRKLSKLFDSVKSMDLPNKVSLTQHNFCFVRLMMTRLWKLSYLIRHLFLGRSICKVLGMKALRRNRLGVALSWCLRAKVTHFYVFKVLL